MKRFSIITITYNAEKYLEENLRSVQSQKFLDYEHIVWDGGSTDKTLDIIKKFPNVFWYQGKDSGIADAMNRGVEFAKGQFLIHLHADDLLAHSKVLSFIDTALKQHPNILWLYGKIARLNERGEKKSHNFHSFNYQRLKRYNCISHPAVCVNRKFFLAQGGFNVRFRYAMDYDLWLRFGKIAEPLAFPTELAFFREHQESLSTRMPKQVAREAYEIRKSYHRTPWERWSSYRTLRRRLKSL